MPFASGPFGGWHPPGHGPSAASLSGSPLPPPQAAAAAAAGHSAQAKPSTAGSGRLVRRVAVAAAAGATLSAGYHAHRTGRLRLPQRPSAPGIVQSSPPFLVPPELVDIICGAVGEIVQVAVLYPLDTLKVRCQAGGLPVGAVVRHLGAAGSPGAVMRQLYAGVFSASLASVAIGSLYYFSFCQAKRAATKMVAAGEARQAAAAAAGATISGGSSSASSGGDSQRLRAAAAAAAAGGGEPGQQHCYPHGSGVDIHGHDPVFAAICSDERAAATASKQQQHKRAAAASSGCSKAGEPASPAAAAAAAAPAEAGISSGGRLQANLLAACAAAVVGALVEAPVELFKHRVQAGQLQGNMLAHIAKALRAQGPAALYGSFFLPFCLKSLPHDIGELLTYACLSDSKDAFLASSKARGSAAAAPAASLACQAPASPATLPQQQPQLALGSVTAAGAGAAALPPAALLAGMPEHGWDMLLGASAGAAAVLVSMPSDCVKTVMETGGGAAAKPGSGPLGSAAAFGATGRALLRQHGPGGLFMGLAPRLVEAVPSTMLYWLSVEATRRMLEPFTAPAKP